MEYTAKEYIFNHRGKYLNQGLFISGVKEGIADLKEFHPEDNVHQIKFFEEVLAELRSTNPIYEIIKRKKAGIDCSEAESAEVKGWLRDIGIPFEQPTFNEVRALFPIEYNEFLEEVEITYKDRLKTFNKSMPEVLQEPKQRKYYLFSCSVANIYRNDHEDLTDEKFIELATAEGMVFNEKDFILYFNRNSVINSAEHFLRII